MPVHTRVWEGGWACGLACTHGYKLPALPLSVGRVHSSVAPPEASSSLDVCVWEQLRLAPLLGGEGRPFLQHPHLLLRQRETSEGQGRHPGRWHGAGEALVHTQQLSTVSFKHHLLLLPKHVSAWAHTHTPHFVSIISFSQTVDILLKISIMLLVKTWLTRDTQTKLHLLLQTYWTLFPSEVRHAETEKIIFYLLWKLTFFELLCCDYRMMWLYFC